MEHAESTLPVQLPDALGPHSVSEEERKHHHKKKKKHKKSTRVNDEDDSPRHGGNDDDNVVKKKKKSKREDGHHAKKKKKKRRTPEEQLMREAARRKSRKQLADFDEAAGISKSSRSRRRHREDSGLEEQQVRVPVRMEDEGQADTGMRASYNARQSTRKLEPDEVDAAFGVMESQDVNQSDNSQPEINWETGEGLVWPNEHGVSLMTPLSAVDEPSLREDMPHPFVPITTSFSGGSPGVSPGQSQWQSEEPTETTEPGPEVDDAYSSRPGANRVDAPPRYEAPVSRYSHSRNRRSSASSVGVCAGSGTGSLLSEKRRNSLPLGLYPIAEFGEPPEKKDKEGGKLSLFPVGESYDEGTTTKQKSQHRLSYSITGESYAQFQTEDGVPGGTYIATRRISDKRRREKERGNGPSYFRSSERYDNENLLADAYGRSYDMEAQALGEERLGAFAVRRTGANVSADSERLLMEDPSDGIQDPSLGAQIVNAEIPEQSNKKDLCPCNRWFKLLVAFLLLAGVAVAIAVPLTLINTDDGSTSYSSEEIAARKQQLLDILEGVSDPNALADESSPQYAAVEWMASEDKMSPLNNGFLSSGITELILQRYALVVIYYSTTGEGWFSSDGWLNGEMEECSWEFIECDNEDVVSINTGARNNLIGDLQPELKELKELRALILQSNAISGLSTDIKMLTNLAELDLSRNAIGGTIPTEIFELVSLRRLVLSENSFTGTLSPLITKLAGLIHLSLDTNNMEGLLTTEFQILSDLKYLDLSNNRFTGDFNTMFAGLDKFESLLLVDNPITGSLPSDIDRFSNLEFLDMAGTDIQGTIPTETGTLSNLQQLLLERIGLTGTIPTELGNLVSLETAYLDFNQLTGSVPVEMCSLPELTDLRVDSNVQCSCEACEV